jgi:hypothetical protein
MPKQAGFSSMARLFGIRILIEPEMFLSASQIG